MSTDTQHTHPIVTDFPPLVLRYSKSVEELVQLGQYGYANPNITTANFPTDLTGEVERIPVLIDFGQDIESDDAFAQMEAMGIEPADEHGTLEFGAKHPDEQRKNPIVGLGKATWFGGGRRVLVLSEWGGGRRADPFYWAGGWNRYCRFLGFRK